MSGTMIEPRETTAEPVHTPAPRKVIKVVHICNFYDGIETTLGPKVFALDRYDDMDVTMISPPGGKRQGAELPIRYIPAEIPRSIRPWRDLRSALRLARIFRRERFDIVHTHTAKAGAIGTLAAWLAGVPLIYHTYHGLPFYDGQPARQYRFYRLFEKAACLMRRHIFSQNRRDMVECLKLIGDPTRVHFEGNGVVPEKVRAIAERDRAGGEAWFQGTGARLLLVSRLEPVKHIDDFVRCVKQLRDDGVDLCCVVAGGGPQKEEIEALIAELGLEGVIRLTGYILNAPAAMAACDIAVLTSEKEGIPRSLMESMALGKPAVATDVLGTQELVVDGETGYLTPLGDVAAMSRRIRELIEDPELRQRFGAAGKARVEKEFNDHRIAEFLHEFYLRDFTAINAETAQP
ncbi:MAG: glycosyltransferase family 4 protein [Alphaproteobacteria bacterium]|nr:glycosyltransferase family 4 protein [Alphaproteobacteria bacterium]